MEHVLKEEHRERKIKGNIELGSDDFLLSVFVFRTFQIIAVILFPDWFNWSTVNVISADFLSYSC